MRVAKLIPIALLCLGIVSGADDKQQQRNRLSQQGQGSLAREVRHELVMLPYYTVFDNLAYKVDEGGVVTLMGQVTRPTLKSDAENVVKRVEGVTRVVNNIEVLPPSPMDDQIRRAAYYTLFGQNSTLYRYGWGAVPPIHIIVNNGRITLYGVVNNETDKNQATIRLKSIPNVFSVDNELQVEK